MTEQHTYTRQSVDWWLIGTYLVLVVIGWLNIFAATHSSEAGSLLSWDARAGKQFVWILTSLGLAAIILYLIPARIWESGCIPFYVAVLGLLVLVIFVSSDVKGSHSWFNLGPVRFQPAEISKISTSLLLAYVMSQQNFRITRWKDFWTVVLIIGVPMLVIIGESETGSALVYAGFIFVLYREGLSGWWLGAIGLVIMLFVGTLKWSAYWSVMFMTAMPLSVVSLWASSSSVSSDAMSTHAGFTCSCVCWNTSLSRSMSRVMNVRPMRPAPSRYWPSTMPSGMCIRQRVPSLGSRSTWPQALRRTNSRMTRGIFTDSSFRHRSR